MKKLPFVLALFMIGILCLTSCNRADKPNSDIKEEPDAPSESDTTAVNLDKDDMPDFTEIKDLFANIITDSTISVSLNSGKIHVKIATNLPSEEAPDGWDAMVTDAEAALQIACKTADTYNAKTVYVEIDSIDEKIMMSGFDSKIQYNMFEKTIETGESNPPTITKFEYDQIAVGMRLTEVREIIGGPGELQNQIGEVSKYSSPISTYRWYGSKDGSYADILFDGYEVYSKVELWLE